MTKYAVCYGVTLLTLLVVDGVWLGLVAKNFYQSQIGHLMAEKVNFLAAGLFYVVYPLGVVYFAAATGLESGEWRDAALRGDSDALVHTFERAPHAKRAHPTDEHYLPLLVALGASNNSKAQLVDGGVAYGILSMDSFVFGDFN